MVRILFYISKITFGRRYGAMKLDIKYNFKNIILVNDFEYVRILKVLSWKLKIGMQVDFRALNNISKKKK